MEETDDFQAVARGTALVDCQLFDVLEFRLFSAALEVAKTGAKKHQNFQWISVF